MRVIGLNYSHDAKNDVVFDGGVALIEDGIIKMAFAEDRISRKKNDGGFSHALQEILKRTNLTLNDIDYFAVSFYAHFSIPEEDAVRRLFEDIPIDNLSEKLIFVPSHHLSHAFSSYFLSPFDEALIVVADNEGSLLVRENASIKGRMYNNCERNSYYYAKNNVVTLIGRDFEGTNDVAFGKAYSKFTRLIGFGDYHAAGKTMGLSAYGDCESEYHKHDLWAMDTNGKLISLLYETFDSENDIARFFETKGITINLDPSVANCESKQSKDLACYIQCQLDKWMLKKVEYLMKSTGTKNVCLSGGVALNGVTNSLLEKELGAKVFVPPYPSDPGQGLGCAVYGFIKANNLDNNSITPKISFDNFTYLGAEYSDEECLSAIKNNSDKCEMISLEKNQINRFIAEQIEDGKIIGIFRGKSEYGARALGNRSVVAKPTSAKLRDDINIKKGRELFRPLAPVILEECANQYFECEESELHKYMLGVVDVKDEVCNKIPGVVHADLTARVQIINQKRNPEFFDLVNEYYKISGIPIIINTSFNRAGEPIVETPENAINSFYNMGLDYLVCGNYVVKIRRPI